MAVVHEYAHALYFESAAMILTLVTVGKYLEARSKSKTSDALGKLVDLAPKTAVVIRGGEEQTIPAEQVVAGDIVVIRPGEGMPVDGVVWRATAMWIRRPLPGRVSRWKSERRYGDFRHHQQKRYLPFPSFQGGRATPRWPRSSAWWTKRAIPRRRSRAWRIKSAAYLCRW